MVMFGEYTIGRKCKKYNGTLIIMKIMIDDDQNK